MATEKKLRLIVTVEPDDKHELTAEEVLLDAAELRRRLNVAAVKVKLRGVTHFVGKTYTIQKIVSKTYDSIPTPREGK